MLEKLRTSLLTPRHAAQLKLTPYAEGHALAIQPNWAGFQIPYFRPDGTLDTFYRFRFTQLKPSTGWRALGAVPEKPRRYAQPAGTGCGVYLPPLLAQPWTAIMRDPTAALVITEGELKAACGCTLGVPTLGLGGVYSWRSHREQQELLPLLEEFAWKDRLVNLCFDSDLHSNPMVRVAASRLAATLAARGAKVLWTELPPGEGDTKQGMDDLAYAAGPQALMDALAAAEPLGAGLLLHQMNTEVALIRATGEIVEMRTGNVYTPTAFTEVLYKHRHYTEWKEKGSVQKFVAKEWLAWHHRATVERTEYEPGQTALITPAGNYNTWAALGWGCVPSRVGNVRPWELLLERLLVNTPAATRQWVRQWFAYPLQNPGAKLSTALLFWGRQQGTGKTMLGETMRYIYGRNYGTVNDEQLSSQFNEWGVDKQFIVGDEISLGDKRHTANALKDMITRTEVRVNIKNRKTYVTRDHINYYFTSNHEDAMYLELNDRRTFVQHVNAEPLDFDEREAYFRWLREEGGAARLFYYLLHEVDCAGFDPYGRAPATAAKTAMMASGRGDTEDWCVLLAADPDAVISQPYDLFRTVDLLKFYDPEGREKTKAVGLGKALGAAGVFQVAGGNNSAVVEGMRTRFWAVRNVDLYRRIGPAQAKRMYEEERQRTPPGGVASSAKFKRVTQ